MIAKTVLAMVLAAGLACGGRSAPTASVADPAKPAPVEIPEDSKGCVDCHTKEGVGVAGIIGEWKRSTHAASGIGCADCHTAKAGDKDAMEHHGATIAVIVTPADCAECHEDEVEEFATSDHATTNDGITETADWFLGKTVEGPQAVVSGCAQCHGSQVKILEGGKPDPTTWPNTGIGRINPDGSKGACTACHPRHLFEASVARRPEVCGKCHLGPDHPQKEIYEESKHGIAFRASEAAMGLEGEVWVLGQDYTAAPTCATCHMSAAPDLEITHDAGERLSWNLRAQVSTRLDGWEKRRAQMQAVCGNCHAKGFVACFYHQLDATVAMYNERYIEPAAAVLAELRKAGKITDAPFDDPIEWSFFDIWRPGGRAARQGAAMLGPDYVQWQGFFVMADALYNHFVPEAERLLPGVTKPLMHSDAHRWHAGRAPSPGGAGTAGTGPGNE